VSSIEDDFALSYGKPRVTSRIGREDMAAFLIRVGHDLSNAVHQTECLDDTSSGRTINPDHADDVRLAPEGINYSSNRAEG
jgi:hypothetical protein